MVDVAKLAIEVDSSQAVAAAKNLDGLSVSAGKADTQAKAAGNGMAGFGKKAGAAGIQIQQFVGQVQGGVSATTALSMQAADLGIVLGFPLLGAVAGITSALAGPFISALFDSSAEAEKLSDKLDEVRNSLLSVQIAEFAVLIDTQQAKLKDLNAQWDEYERLGVTNTKTANDLANSIDTETEVLDELLSRRDKLKNDNYESIFEKEIELVKERQKAEEELARAQGQYNSLITGLVASRFSEEEMAAQSLATTMQQVQALRDQDLISNDQYLAAKTAAEQNYADDVAMINQRKIENDRATLQTYSDVLGTMAQVAQQGGKEQFDAYKALASAQALIATYLAATRALAEVPYPLNFVAAGVVSAAGAVQVAQIQSQEYQGSYLGGGYTGQGSRTGGIDGMGGFPAILHPDETVIDHRLSGGYGGGMQANITVNNNASGATASVRRIDDANFIIDVISADAARGGRGSKAIAGAYGLRRAAR